MGFETILYDVKDQIATITLNRPEVMNAMGGGMRQELIDVFDLTDQDDDVRAVVVTGAGKAFCGGADFSKGAAVFDKNRDPANSPVRADGSIDYSNPLSRDGGGILALR